MSPFILLIIPFFVALALIAGNTGNDMVQEQISLNASFLKLPEVNMFNILSWWK